uniref:Uncharacterized protein n=1 Tax=Fundulus heteroclitus TaxID=8078 RepID=A0A3Q2QU28_FUNHE
MQRKIVCGIYVIQHSGADPDVDPEHIEIVFDGVEVLSALKNVPITMAMFLGLVYALNISYPPETKYTCQAVQKIIMEIGSSFGRKPINHKLMPINLLSLYFTN